MRRDILEKKKKRVRKMKRKMRVLVTGEKGFIGRHLWKRLEKEGYELKGYDLQDG